jgi:hypothetical protein
MIRKRFMKHSIEELTTQFVFYHSHPVGHAEKTASIGDQVTRRRPITCVVRATSLHETLKSHPTQEIEMSKQKLPIGVSNVKGWGTLLGSVPRGRKGRKTLLTHGGAGI